MAEIRCEKVSRGLRPEERTVMVRNAVTGLRSFLRVEADFLTYYNGHHYLPVGVIQEEPEQGLVLVELPQEPDAGSTRLWIRAADFLPSGQVVPGQWEDPRMTEIRCEEVSPGLRKVERAVTVRDAVTGL